MSTQHTPGPWVADDNEGFSPWTIWSRMSPTGHGITGPQVASVIGDSDEADANASLIAAAPDLLGALKEARDELEYSSPGIQTKPLLDLIDAAIAKATGGTA